jgi:NAD-dependent SIR2 family protein deacetylase
LTEKVACAHCGQDWIQKFRRKDTGEQFYLCPECESLWLDERLLREDTDMYLSEFLGTQDPGDNWNIIERVDPKA